MMKIGIDARTTSIGGGARNYVLNLLHSIAEIDSFNEYVIFYDSKDMVGHFNDVHNFNEKYVKNKGKMFVPLWNQILLPINLNKEKIDLIHGTKNEIPFLLNECKSVVTVHDVTPFLFPNDFMLPDRIYWKKVIPLSLKRAERIIAISQHTKNDIVQFFCIPPDKIDVILHGLPSGYCIISDYKILGRIKNKYSLSERFILYVGTIRPRKNIGTLIKSLYKLKQNKGIAHKLVITGKKLWKEHELFKLILDLGLENEVLFTGFIIDEDMPAIYNLADLLVYPSFYEGFGFPPLEAMACGTPVITSNTSSLPEVVGDAGIMIDPHDVDGLAKAMYEVLINNELRDEMIKKGLDRAKQFSWNKCAEETLKVYEEVYNEG